MPKSRAELTHNFLHNDLSNYVVQEGERFLLNEKSVKDILLVRFVQKIKEKNKGVSYNKKRTSLQGVKVYLLHCFTLSFMHTYCEKIHYICY